MIKLVNFSKQFGSLDALRNVSINIMAGEILAIVGHNGSGKSTLLKSIAGVIEPETGEIWIDGQEIKTKNVLQAKKHGIEFLSQEQHLFPSLSVLENMFIGSELYYNIAGIKVVNRKYMVETAKNLHKKLNIDLLPLDKPVSTLSHGQKALVSFLRILNLNPVLLALDEPTASLGYSEREAVNNLIMGLSKKNVSILLVTHILEDVFRLANRVIILKNGISEYYGSVDEITKDEIIRHMIK